VQWRRSHRSPLNRRTDTLCDVEIAFSLVALAVAVLAFTAVAGRLGWSAPLVLIAVGIVASYLPFVPEVHLHHEVVLLGLLPPLLYATAIQTSLVDFNANRRPILLLSVGLVVFTAAGVGAVVHALLPGISWAAAFAIGAVVAPPDAVAATAIARRIGLPRRLVTILEGESLLNDATALVALRTAIAAASTSVAFVDVGLDFVQAAGGGVLLGLGTFFVVAYMRKHVTDTLLDTAISLVTPYAAYIVAEELHASGVLAVVIAGLLLGHKAPILQTAQSRIAEKTNWRTIAFVLENTVFLLIGLQARWILEEVSDSDLSTGRIVAVCAASLAAVIVLRLLWVFPVRYLLVRPKADATTGRPPPWTYTFVLGWAGMRGVVTLAAAFVIPEDTDHREILLLIAFTVVAGTLFLQGLTLPWVAARLRVPSPDPAEDALARATLLHQATEAAYEVLERELGEDPHGVNEVIRQRIEQRNFAAWEQLGSSEPGVETPSETYARLRLSMIAAERAKVLEVRSQGDVPSDVVREVLAMLDVEESMLDLAQETEDEVEDDRRAERVMAGLCEDLAMERPRAVPRTPRECEECVRDGTQWVHLRLCLDCGHVGCCDSSPNRHATAHFQDSGHRVMQSHEPGESWRWCFVHHVTG
jgi:monovalent cation/hydrogen antiporter